MKLLIIEDEQETQNLIKTILKDYPYSVSFAQTLAAGMDLKESQSPDIILLDVKLPDSHESQLGNSVRSLKRGSPVSVWVLSSYLSPQLRKEAEDAGADGSFDKDILIHSEKFILELTKAWYELKIKTTDDNTGARSAVHSLALKRADIPQSEILLVLHEQNANQERTNFKLFEKLDKAAAAAQAAKEKAGHVAEVTEEIKNQFIALNSKTSKTIERVASLEDSEKRRKEDEERIKLIKQGMWVIPKKVTSWLTTFGNILVGILAVVGGIVSAFEFVEWLLSLQR